jgi:hypothetical protein
MSTPKRDDRVAREAAKTQKGKPVAPPAAELFPVKGVLSKLFSFLSKLSPKK